MAPFSACPFPRGCNVLNEVTSTGYWKYSYSPEFALERTTVTVTVPVTAGTSQ